MPVVLERGDLFATPDLKAFAHGCNCAGAMGKGIALAFRERWPAMYEAYKAQCQDGRFDLGSVFHWQEDGFTIFNLGTQKTWRTKADLDAIAEAVAQMIQIASALDIRDIGLPRIGAGLGGLAWIDVLEVLETLAADATVRLRVCEEHVPGQPLAPIDQNAG